MRSAVFADRGSKILTACDDHRLRLWNAFAPWVLGEPYQHRHPLRAAVPTADGGAVFVDWTGTVSLLDGKPGARPVHLFRREGAEALALSPDGSEILIGGAEGTAAVWRVRGRQFVVGPLAHDGGPVGCVAWSADRRRLLTGGWDGTARLWNAATGEPVGPPLRHTGLVRAVAFSEDGRTVLTGSWDRTARLWDADNGWPVGEPLRHPEAVNAVAISPDGSRVVTGCADGSLHLWDARSGRPAGTPYPGQGATVWSVAFSPRTDVVLFARDDGLAVLWHLPAPAPDDRERLRAWLRRSSQAAGRAAEAGRVLAGLVSPPDEIDLRPAAEALAAIASATGAVRRRGAEAEDLARRCGDVEADLRAYVRDNPECPTCGGPLDADALLSPAGAHAHER